MLKMVISAGFYGCGVGVLLGAVNQTLPISVYLSNIPIYALFVAPIGLAWRKKILAPINADQFPPDMINYKQMFLTSRKAVVYDFILNQLIYHSALAVTVLILSYYVRKLADITTKPKPLLMLFRDIGVDFLIIKLGFACISVLSEFWGMKMSLINKNGNFTMNNYSKKFLLLKESVLQIVWMAAALGLMHQRYPLPNYKTEQ